MPSQSLSTPSHQQAAYRIPTGVQRIGVFVNQTITIVIQAITQFSNHRYLAIAQVAILSSLSAGLGINAVVDCDKA